MDISLLSVSRAPCVPFSSRPRRNAGQYCRSKQLVRCAAQNEEEGDKKNEIARNLGKVCAPFAAAMLLMAQTQPAFAETPYEQSMRVQREFQSSGSRLDSFFNKGTTTSDVLANSGNVKAAAGATPIESPVDAVKDAAKDVQKSTAPAKKGLIGLFEKNNAPKAEEVKGAASDAKDAVKSALPDAGDAKNAVKSALPTETSTEELTDKAKEAAEKVSEAAPTAQKGGGFFGGFFNKVPKPVDTPKPIDVKDAAGDAAATAKESAEQALPDPVKPSEVASNAKDAAGKAADAVPSSGGGFLDGLLNSAPDAGDVKGAVDDAASSAKDALPNSDPSGIVSGAKDAANKVADAAPSFPGEAVDSAKDSAKEVVGAAKDEAEVVGTGNKAPSGSGFFSNFLGGAQSTAEDVKGSAKEAASSAQDALPSTGDVKDALPSSGDVKDALPSTGDVKDALPSGGEVKEAVKDAAPDSGFFGGLFGGAKSTAEDVKGSAQDAASDAKAALPDAGDVKDALPSGGEVKEAVKDAAPNTGFFGNFLGDAKSTAEDVKGSAQEAASDAKDVLPSGGEVKSAVQEAAPDNKSDNGIFGNLFGGATPQPASPPSNQLEAPQPSSLEEDTPKGAEPLPEQPYPESEKEVPAGSSGQDSAGGKVQDSSSGGGILDSFGGGPSGKSQTEKSEALVEQAKKPNPASNFLGDIFGAEGNPLKGLLDGTSSAPTNEVRSVAALPPPQPSDVEEAGNLPEKAPGTENKLPEQPKPEGKAPEDLGKDSAGGKTTTSAQKPVSLTFAAPAFNEIANTAQLDPPQPSAFQEKEPESAPGQELQPEEQPAPEPEKKELPQDSSGGKTGSTKDGSGPLDFFGGSAKDGKQPVSSLQKPASLIADAPAFNEVATTAQLDPPQPSAFEEKEPESAPGQENQPEEQPAPEPESKELPKDSSGGKTGSTKDGSGPLDFFGGSAKDGKQPVSSLQKPASLIADAPAFNEVATTAQLDPPQPSAFEEKEPESAPGQELQPEEQPAPEPENKELPQDSAGGKTQDTKNGSGPLDSFGGPTGKDSSQKAADNVNKASASVPASASNELGRIAEVEGAEEAGVAVEKPDGGKATLIGVAFSIALEIAIFSTTPRKEGKKGAH